MANMQQESERGILNETSKTIHKRKRGKAEFQTLCGQTYRLEHRQLREIEITQATEEFDAEKCGSCFEDGRGY